MPFDQVQCVDLADGPGMRDAPGWQKVVASVRDLVGGEGAPAASVAGPAPLPTKPSIAVMPFANLWGDPEQEYFADGMVEEIVAALSRSTTMFVIASGSTAASKARPSARRRSAAELGVRYTLEGNVRGPAAACASR